MDYKQRFIDIFESKVTREGSKELLEWICSTDFFIAPVSTGLLCTALMCMT